MTFFSNHTTAIRRGFILGVVLAMFGFALWYPHTGVDGAATNTAEVAVDTRPNVIVIMTDDMRVDDLDAMDKTVNLLAGDNGARFTRFHATTPLCCPSRATFLSGQYAHNTGVFQNHGPNGGVGHFRDQEALPVWLKRAGYRTIHLGKYLNNYGHGTDPDAKPADYVPPGWDLWKGITDPHKYRDFHVTSGSSGAEASNRNGTQTLIAEYQTNWLEARALAQINSSTPGQPFYMEVMPFTPHQAPTPDDDSRDFLPAELKYKGVSQAANVPVEEGFDEFDVSDKPAWIRSLPRLDEEAEANIRTHRRERRDALYSVDDMVASIVNALRDNGQLANTVIMFTSDNGWMAGEHRLGRGKTWPYRQSVRIPLLVRGSEWFGTGTRPGLAGNIDVAPTIVDLAQAQQHVGILMDGRSLLDPIPATRELLIEFPEANSPNKTGMPAWTGLVTDNAWLVEYANGVNELYDMNADPWQRNNQANVAALNTRQSNLHQRLVQLCNNQAHGDWRPKRGMCR